MSLFNFSLLEEQHCKEAARFLGGIFPNSDLSDHRLLRWQLIDAPGIRPISILARSVDAPNNLVGMLSAIPQKFLVNGKTLIGAYLANAAVDSSVRQVIWKNSEGHLENIFLSLARQIKEVAMSQGWDFLYVIPNDKSIRAYRKNLKYNFEQDTPLFARPVNIGRLLNTKIQSRYLAYIAGGLAKFVMMLWENIYFLFPNQLKVSRISTFDSAFDDLLSQNEYEGRIKDIAVLNHRFTQCPSREYEIYAALKDDRPIGYLVFGQSVKQYGEHSFQCGMVADYFYLPSEQSTSSRFFSEAISDYEKRHNIDIWLCLVHKQEELSVILKKNLFFDITSRFPRKFLLMVDPITDIQPEDIFNIPYHFGDYDVV